MTVTSSMPERIAALSAAGFSEEELAIKMDLSFEEVRKYKFIGRAEVESPMCMAALHEMRVVHEGKPLKELAKIYYCSLLDVRKALYSKLKSRRPVYNHDEILAYIREYGVDEATEHFGCHYLLPRYIARKAGILPPARPKPRAVTEYQKTLARTLADSKKYNQEQIAEALHLSQSTVSKIVSTTSKGPYNRKTKEERLKIAKYAEKHSVTEAHRKYGVSRAAVYKWMKEKDNG